ncbi:MAG: hypothetical protein PHV93_00970 [Candidatus Pacebacteria bacterium]|nr:hypothetical protein [Candidatus Paceibacterota bacterium]
MNPTTSSRFSPLAKTVLAIICIALVIALALFLQNYIKRRSSGEVIQMPILTKEQQALLNARLKTVPPPVLTAKQQAEMTQKIKQAEIPALTEEEKAALEERLQAGQ